MSGAARICFSCAFVCVSLIAGASNAQDNRGLYGSGLAETLSDQIDWEARGLPDFQLEPLTHLGGENVDEALTKFVDRGGSWDLHVNVLPIAPPSANRAPRTSAECIEHMALSNRSILSVMSETGGNSVSDYSICAVRQGDDQSRTDQLLMAWLTADDQVLQFVGAASVSADDAIERAEISDLLRSEMETWARSFLWFAEDSLKPPM